MAVYRKEGEDTIPAPITWFFLSYMEPIYSHVKRNTGELIPGRGIIGTTHGQVVVIKGSYR
jgi:hypothetical protein